MRSILFIIIGLISKQFLPAQESLCKGLKEKIETSISKSTLNKAIEGEGTLLIQAIKCNEIDLVKILIKAGAEVNLGVKGDGSPLIEASKNGNLSIVTLLVENNADVDIYIDGDETPLINASAKGHLDIVKFLVDKGADINKTVIDTIQNNQKPRSALSMAKLNNQFEVAEFLMCKGAKS